jgi:hypothetical protein
MIFMTSTPKECNIMIFKAFCSMKSIYGKEKSLFPCINQMKTTNMYHQKNLMQSIFVYLIINEMNLNQMQVISTSLLSMEESNADTT